MGKALKNGKNPELSSFFFVSFGESFLLLDVVTTAQCCCFVEHQQFFSPTVYLAWLLWLSSEAVSTSSRFAAFPSCFLQSPLRCSGVLAPKGFAIDRGEEV